MANTMDYLGNFPFKKGEPKKVCKMDKSNLFYYLYTPELPFQSDLNWMYCSTDELNVGVYQLAPGSHFDPVDIHAGDEFYYILKGTVTVLNPDLGQVIEVSAGEAALLPKGCAHQGFNFTNEEAVILCVIVPCIWDENGPPEGYFKKPKLLKNN
jgi:gentisate 1,2-dioxygenase